MAIWITKLICAIIGWFVYGWIGALVGLVIVGPALCFLIGLIATAKDGGLLNAEQRRYLAGEFARDRPDIVDAVTQGLSSADRQAFLESSVERVHRKALMLSKGYEIQHGGMDRAGDALAEEESEPSKIILYRSLAEYLAARSRTNWT